MSYSHSRKTKKSKTSKRQQKGGNCPFQSGGDSWHWVQDRVGGLGQQQADANGVIAVNGPMTGGKRQHRKSKNNRKSRKNKTRSN